MEGQVLETKKNTVVRKRSIKPPAIQSEIIARRVSGQNKTRIARELGIAQNTVTSVLALNNVEAMFEDGRIGAMKRIPKALETLDVRLEKNSESAALWLLDKCFDDSKVTGKRMTGDVTLNQTLQVLLKGSDDPKDEKLKSPVINVIENTPSDK